LLYYSDEKNFQPESLFFDAIKFHTTTVVYKTIFLNIAIAGGVGHSFRWVTVLEVEFNVYIKHKMEQK